MSDDALSIQAGIALEGFRLEIDHAVPMVGVSAVFGPSGSGKTTLLNLVAGFLKPDRGRIALKDEVWCDRAGGDWVPAHRRPVGMVFQDGRLFPHLSVRGNLDFANARSMAAPHHYDVDEIISATGISMLLDRAPQTLSGGERQRVAVARTLLTHPKLVLFDEPLAGLDRDRKRELLPFLKDLTDRFAIPALYVSHDVDEVSRIADRVILLTDGEVVASGATADVLGAAGLMAGRNPYEAGSQLFGTLVAHHRAFGLSEVTIGDATVWLPAPSDMPTGASVALHVPARDVAIALTPPDGLSIQNVLTATIVDVSSIEASAFCNVRLAV
ncbi:MAG: molybdenum ABC transporter ATP-binding protein, partial [Pseudomonadota bacterium]